MPLPSERPLTPSFKHELIPEEQGLWECRGPEACRPLSGSEAQGHGQDVCEGYILEHRNQGVHGTCLHRSPELHYQDSQMLPPPYCPLAMSGGTRSLLRAILLGGSISPIFHTPSDCFSVVGEVVLFLSSTQAYKYVRGTQKHFRVSGRMHCVRQRTA